MLLFCRLALGNVYQTNWNGECGMLDAVRTCAAADEEGGNGT